MPQNQGPFSQYITEPFEPNTPKPTGLEGGGATTAYIASKFLDGIKQHRMQKFALQQQEEDKSRQQFERAIDFVSKRSDLLPGVRNSLLSKLNLPFLQQIAGTKETGKDTGNHLTDFFKHVAKGMTGGELPKGKIALDPSVIAESFSTMADPNNTIQAVLSQSEQAVGKILGSLQERGPVTRQLIESNSDLQRVLSHARNITGVDGWLPGNMRAYMEYAPVDELDMKKRQVAKDELDFKSGVLNRMTGRPTAQTSAPPSVQSGQVSPIPQQLDSSLPTTATSNPPVNVLRKAHEENRMMGIAGYKPEHFIDNTPDDFMTPDGKIVQGVHMRSDTLGTGIFDVVTGQLIQGARKATANDKNRLPEDQIQSKYTQYVSDMEKAVGPEFAKPYAPSVMANLRSGDEKGAADQIGRALAAKQQHENTMAIRSQAAAQLAQSGDNTRAAAMMRLGSNFDNSDFTKGMRTADQYYRTAIDGAKRASSDPTSAALHDLEQLRTWAKLTDIMTGVREREYQDIASIMGRLRSAGLDVDNIVKMKGDRLDPAARKAVMDSITSIYSTVRGQWLSQANKIRSQAVAAKIDPNLVAPLNQFGNLTDQPKSATDTPPDNNVTTDVKVIKPNIPGGKFTDSGEKKGNASKVVNIKVRD